MALNVTELNKYVNESSKKLVKKAALDSKSISMFTKQTGIKSSAAIQVLTGDTELSSSPCDFVESGTTKLSQRKIEVAPYTYYESFCDEDLAPYWTQFVIKTANPTLGQFEREFIDFKLAAINRLVEKCVWQGDKASTNATLKINDGLLKILKEATNTIKVEADMTAASIRQTVKDVYMAIPAAVLAQGDAVIMMGVDAYRLYQMALVDSNLYHFSGAQASDVFEVIMPGTNVKVVGVPGLDGTDAIVACSLSNIVAGCDMESDFDSFRFWFSDDAGKFKMSVKFRLGVNVAFPDEVVLATKA